MPGMSLPFGRDLAIRHLGLGHRLEIYDGQKFVVIVSSSSLRLFSGYCVRDLKSTRHMK
jgi:hypothetical protein